VQTEIAPRVSVVIASHRGDSIARCIGAFGPGTWETVPAEVLVVADYPIDKLAIGFPQCTWRFCPDKSISAKRNLGVGLARGDIIAFIDDDCRPGLRWISAAVEFLDRNPAACGVVGRTSIETTGKPGAALGQFKRLEKQGYRTNNVFFRRAAFESAGMFDTRFTVQREDLDLAFTLIERGQTIAFSDDIKVEHALRANERWDLLKNCINRRFDPLLYRKHPALYRRHVRSPFPPGILFLLACHCAAVAAAVTGYAGIGVLLFDAAAVVVLTLRRARGARPGALQWVREYCACAISPVVLLGALIYGSVKFRSMLLI
jgi:glycosyltransferase involved in cell wall biosynthesis